MTRELLSECCLFVPYFLIYLPGSVVMPNLNRLSQNTHFHSTILSPSPLFPIHEEERRLTISLFYPVINEEKEGIKESVSQEQVWLDFSCSDRKTTKRERIMYKPNEERVQDDRRRR